MTRKNGTFKVKRRSYVLDPYLADGLAGAHIVIGAMNGHEMRGIAAGTITEAGVIDLVADRVLEHNLDVESILDVDAEDVASILEAWQKAQETRGLDPTPASS